MCIVNSYINRLFPVSHSKTNICIYRPLPPKTRSSSRCLSVFVNRILAKAFTCTTHSLTLTHPVTLKSCIMRSEFLFAALCTSFVAAAPRSFSYRPTTDAEARTSPQLQVRQNATVIPPDTSIDPNAQTTRNDLVNGPCRANTLVFARGTFEPGNVGKDVGPPLFNDLASLIGPDAFAIQGVDYPASLEGYIQATAEKVEPVGAPRLQQLVDMATTNCPNSKIFLGGYSQGAQVVHLGAAMLSDNQLQSIAGVMLFGDPMDGNPIRDVPTAKIDDTCLQFDFICRGLPIPGPEHKQYNNTVGQTALFIKNILDSS